MGGVRVVWVWCEECVGGWCEECVGVRSGVGGVVGGARSGVWVVCGVCGAYLVCLLHNFHTYNLCTIEQSVLSKRGKTEHTLHLSWRTK